MPFFAGELNLFYFWDETNFKYVVFVSDKYYCLGNCQVQPKPQFSRAEIAINQILAK